MMGGSSRAMSRMVLALRQLVRSWGDQLEGRWGFSSEGFLHACHFLTYPIVLAYWLNSTAFTYSAIVTPHVWSFLLAIAWFVMLCVVIPAVPNRRRMRYGYRRASSYHHGGAIGHPVAFSHSLHGPFHTAASLRAAWDLPVPPPGYAERAAYAAHRSLTEGEGEGTDAGLTTTPVWGMRKWVVRENCLEGVNSGLTPGSEDPRGIWLPGTNEAVCTRVGRDAYEIHSFSGVSYRYSPFSPTELSQHQAEVPNLRCTCGFYASFRLPLLGAEIEMLSVCGLAAGTAIGWGKVIACDDGWRASRAMVAVLHDDNRGSFQKLLGPNYPGVLFGRSWDEVADKTMEMVDVMAGKGLMREGEGA